LAEADYGRRGVRGSSILDRVPTTVTEWLAVVKLEPVARRAPSAFFVYVPAAIAVALTHRAPDRRRDVA
jgi:hypothetical protein